MVSNRSCCFLVTAMLFWILVGMSSAEAISHDDVAKQCEEIYVKARNTPLSVSYTLELLSFHPDFPVLERLPDGKVRVHVTNVHQIRNGQEVRVERIDEWSEEYGVPFSEARTSNTVSVFENQFRIQQTIDRPQYTMVTDVAYDGLDTRVLTSSTRKETGTVLREGAMYPNQAKQILLVPMPVEGFLNPKAMDVEVSLTTDTQNHVSIQILGSHPDTYTLSPEEGWRLVSIQSERGAAAIVQDFSAPVRIGDIFLPTSIESKKFDRQGRPELFYRVSDAKYTALDPAVVGREFEITFPPDTVINTTEGSAKLFPFPPRPR